MTGTAPGWLNCRKISVGWQARWLRLRKFGWVFKKSWNKLPPPQANRMPNNERAIPNSQGARIHANQNWHNMIRVGMTR